LVSVKTTGGLPKERLLEAMELISEIEIAAPVTVGQVIAKDFTEEGIDLIVTKRVEER
jgi:CxxC motif-containing protein